MESEEPDFIGRHIKNYTFLDKVGKGSQGIVYEAIPDNSKDTVAIKVMSKKTLEEKPYLKELAKTEITVLKECKNDNIIKFIDNFESQECLFIVTEFCNGGDLQTFLQKNVNIPEDNALMFLKQILNGFKGLHQKKTMHRDFKTANVLLHNNVCKIADLGYSKQFDMNAWTKTIIGTKVTMAPEMLDGKSYGFKADIWSIGVVFYQMLFGKYPYVGKNQMDLLKKIRKNKPDFSSVHISHDAQDFISKCLTIHPEERIQWSEISYHSLLNKKQGNMLYGVKLEIDIADQQQFYTKTGLPPEEDPSILEGANDIEFQKIMDEKKEDEKKEFDKINEKRMEREMIKEKQRVFSEFEKLYLEKRNNISFVFKFIQPYAGCLQFIKARHETALFILCKKAFLQMDELAANLLNKINIFNTNLSYFEDFTKSSIYSKLKKQIQGDLQIFKMTTVSHFNLVEEYTEEILEEGNIEKKGTQYFEELVYEVINDYWYELSGGLTTHYLADYKKNNLIEVLQALDYLKKAQKINAEQFQKKIMKLNHQEAQKKILDKL